MHVVYFYVVEVSVSAPWLDKGRHRFIFVRYKYTLHFIYLRGSFVESHISVPKIDISSRC